MKPRRQPSDAQLRRVTHTLMRAFGATPAYIRASDRRVAAELEGRRLDRLERRALEEGEGAREPPPEEELDERLSDLAEEMSEDGERARTRCAWYLHKGGLPVTPENVEALFKRVRR